MTAHPRHGAPPSLRLPLAIPPAAQARVAARLSDGWLHRYSEAGAPGPSAAARLEVAMAGLAGRRHAVAVNSCGSAMFLALRGAGVMPGDPVLVNAFTLGPVPGAVLHAGARPVAVEITDDLVIDESDLARATRETGARVLLLSHMRGHLADMGRLVPLAADLGLTVIEDCAQAHGATWRGRPAGSFGACACFSFYPTKNLGALGDGGAVVTNDTTLDAKLRRLRQYGWERKYFSSDAGGMNSRLDELQAAILALKLRHLPAWNERRRRIAALYQQLLAGTSLVLPATPADGDHVFHLYVVRSRERDRLAVQLRSQGIGCDIHYPLPAYQQPIYRQYAPHDGLPVTEQLAREILSLPMYPELTDAEVRFVAAAIHTPAA